MWHTVKCITKKPCSGYQFKPPEINWKSMQSIPRSGVVGLAVEVHWLHCTADSTLAGELRLG